MENFTFSEKMKVIVLGLLVPIIVLFFIFMFNPDPFLWHFVDVDKLEVVHGEILSSSIALRGSLSMNSLAWHFDIKYGYTVNGKYYISDRVNFGPSGSSEKSFALSYIEKYPVGKDIVVYYDNKQPHVSVLEPLVKDYQVINILVWSVVFGGIISSLSIFIK